MKFFKLDCYTREKNFPSFITDLFLNYKVTDARKVQPHFFGQDPFIFFFLHKENILTPEVDGLRNWDF